MLVGQFAQAFRLFPSLKETMHPTGPDHLGVADRGILALVNPIRLKRILEKLFDENEFLSPYGIRSVSRYHADHPYVFEVHGDEYRVHYLPGESDTSMFGGNTNWRGPIWFPMNIVIIRALLNFYLYYGETFRVEFPTGSHNLMNLFDISKNIAQRLSEIFLPDEDGRRPVYGRYQKFQSDPHWHDYLNFFEYFNAYTGAGLGASHQTGWTGVIARAMHLFATTNAADLLELGRKAFTAGTDAPKDNGNRLATMTRKRQDVTTVLKPGN